MDDGSEKRGAEAPHTWPHPHPHPHPHPPVLPPYGDGQAMINMHNGIGAPGRQRDAESSPALGDSRSGAVYPGPVAGLQALCNECTKLYPDQPNPLQVTARIKYWLGGPDPLDYISMYWNPGNSEYNVPPHWHYVSFGLSDLHGDGRVHTPPPSGPLPPDRVSGLGFELTFRVAGERGRPPTWPAALLQRLATYVFKTGNLLCPGDHVSWHSALDGSDPPPPNVNYNRELNKQPDGKKRRSKIRHMLMAQDPMLKTVDTPLGKVQFVQVVGVTERELKAAQRAGGMHVLEILADDMSCGGKWMVTDVDRPRSVRMTDTTRMASDLSGVAAVCQWTHWSPLPLPSQMSTDNFADAKNKETGPELSQVVKEQIRCLLKKGLSDIKSSNINDEVEPDPCRMSTDSDKVFVDKFAERKESENPSKDIAMSTESFEMSKIEASLIEDVMKSNDFKSNKTDSKIEDQKSVKDDTNDEKHIDECTCEPKNTEAGAPLAKCQKCTLKEFWPQKTEYLKGVHLIFDLEAGSLLPMALRGRVLHGRHFTWTSVNGLQAITLVAERVSGAVVSLKQPIAVMNSNWLQLLITDEFASEMAEKLDILVNNDGSDSEEEALNSMASCPNSLNFAWPEKGLRITVGNNLI